MRRWYITLLKQTVCFILRLLHREFLLMRQLRFYEKNETVKQAVTLLFKFPPDVRSVLARGFCQLAESDFDAHVVIKDFKRLGKEKVLALYKSAQKRREYDCDPYLTKAMNYLMILNPDEQFFISVKLLDLMHVVRDFMVVCKQHAVKLQLAMVEKITNMYVHCGRKEAEEFLTNSKNLFERMFIKNDVQPKSDQLAPHVPTNDEKDAFWRSIATEGYGMRLKMSPDFI